MSKHLVLWITLLLLLTTSSFSQNDCVTTTGFIERYSALETLEGLIYNDDELVFSTVWVNKQLEITIDHGTESIWTPMVIDINLAGDTVNGSAVYMGQVKKMGQM